MELGRNRKEIQHSEINTSSNKVTAASSWQNFLEGFLSQSEYGTRLVIKS